MNRLLLFVVLFCLSVAPAFGADPKLEKGVPLPDGVPDALKSELSATGFRVINESGAPYVEVWLAKSLAGEAKPAGGDVAYPGLPDGVFLGVWRFVANGSDYRGQTVKPGLFTMRYALMPADGNHMGAFPYRDFVLLVPIGADVTPATALKWDSVVALSKKSAGTNHPAVFPMVPAEGGGDAALVKDDQGHYLVKAPVATKAGGNVTIQVVVIGRGEA